VQSFSASQPIDRFSVSGPDEDGYAYLVAHSGSQSGQIMRTRWAGSGFQEFNMAEGEFLAGFETRGPDSQGYVYLQAVGSEGSSGAVLRSQLEGIAVQSWTGSSSGISGFNVSGPDQDGYCYLSVIGSNQMAGAEPTRQFSLAAIGNPVSDKARISYSVAQSCPVSICVYDPSGRLVNTLVNENQPSGSHQVIWDGTDNSGMKVHSGVYFVKMRAGNSSAAFSAARKLVLVK
jgi:hypothetical protein